jgi:FkbM family methyltransferase
LIVDTRALFCRLLRTFEVTKVCDVGSMDGYDALRFRRALPAADIIALEPNPRNFALMQADEQLRRKRIRILPLAASDSRTEAPFFVVAADYVPNRDLPRRGMSSLHQRSDSALLAEVVQVRTARLDELLGHEPHTSRQIALWIDTEGMAYEAIAGAAGVLHSTSILHVEVETEPCIGAGQRLFPDVERTLRDAGFVLLATDKPRDAAQFNALFVRADLLRAKAAAIRWQVARARLYWNTKRAVRPLFPLRLRRFLARRLHARPA